MLEWNAAELQKNLARRGMESLHCQTRQEALTAVLRKVPKGASVCWGGSVTLKQLGLIDALKSDDYVALDRLAAKDEAELRLIYSECMLADYFFCSANAITQEGELVNMDGNGNRVSCMMYGPSKVIVVIGKNKLVENVSAGLARIREIAAPMNAKRANYQTGCLKAGRCIDCYTDECMCGHFVVTRFNRTKGRIKVILVDEELGY